MKQSELSKRLTKAIKSADKMFADIQRDIGQVVEAFKELKDLVDKEKDNGES